MKTMVRKSKKTWKPDDERVFSLRLPHGLYVKLEKDALLNHRSVNSHLLALIEERIEAEEKRKAEEKGQA